MELKAKSLKNLFFGLIFFIINFTVNFGPLTLNVTLICGVILIIKSLSDLYSLDRLYKPAIICMISFVILYTMLSLFSNIFAENNIVDVVKQIASLVESNNFSVDILSQYLEIIKSQFLYIFGFAIAELIILNTLTILCFTFIVKLLCSTDNAYSLEMLNKNKKLTIFTIMSMVVGCIGCLFILLVLNNINFTTSNSSPTTGIEQYLFLIGAFFLVYAILSLVAGIGSFVYKILIIIDVNKYQNDVFNNYKAEKKMKEEELNNSLIEQESKSNEDDPFKFE